MQKQTSNTKKTEVVRQCFVFDASVAPLGRIATIAATLLMGKNKPSYVPYLDNGDYVIIINASKVVLTGNKLNKKLYFNQVSKQPGGLRTRTARTMRDQYPEEMVRRAVWGMLPKGPLGRQMVKKLLVIADDTIPATYRGKTPVAYPLPGRN